MAAIPHVPVLRFGVPYTSLDQVAVKAHRDGSVRARVSQANPGLVRRDLRDLPAAAAKLRALPIARLLAICKEAGDRFLHDTLPLGEPGTAQSPDDYVHSLSSTSGLPHRLVRANMEKVVSVMTRMETILRGLTRGLDLSVLDSGVGEQDGVPVGFAVQADALGAVLPSNSPGVHSLWIPAIALKVPVILKPGREEPWTPMRIVQSLIAAGCPREAFGFYPTSHEGASAILERCGRSLLFGDASTTEQWAGDPRIELHGPGRSKVLLAADTMAELEKHLDVIVESVAGNGGRSCVNASSVFVHANGAEVARKLAERFVRIVPRRDDDAEATLSAFANPAMAERMDSTIDSALRKGGATDVTAQLRGTPRRVVHEGGTYLHPTVVHCDSVEHALARTEFLFPFTSVVEVPQERMLESLGPTLVATAITRDTAFQRALLDSPHIHRLNLGPVPTGRVDWDQPHEGNLFELLYTRRAIHRLAGWAS